ncbi:hypothetical protein SAMN05443999_10331 [Roseovarius azorensis]|uniref:Uncharacterized protein n=1 Tax=Roseovarius azorensis TaxID=1287727 RepID=A0A1H7LDD4_9RHOB|nr:hypothetical protein [Roseovarius azorensis]SEK96810.1 hypothetical protein SAMN05443999_10331 [Roseovarius azorensis]
MTDPADPPERQTPQPRHALLFELIRQRGMAQSVNRRIARTATPDPADLSHFAVMAARSLTRADATGARL